MPFMRFYIKKAWLKSTVSLREDCSRCRAVAVPLPYLSENKQGSYIGKTYRMCKIPLQLTVKILYIHTIYQKCHYSNYQQLTYFGTAVAKQKIRTCYAMKGNV